VDDTDFQQNWSEVRANSKDTLSTFLNANYCIDLDPHSLLDIQVKRIHECKKQLLTVLFCIDRYNKIRARPKDAFVPRTVIFGGKAAPDSQMPKLIIRLINDVAEIVNNDPAIENRLRIIFIENFGVSLSERIYPAADLSEQISSGG
jgi:starch phosphorylase